MKRQTLIRNFSCFLAVCMLLQLFMPCMMRVSAQEFTFGESVSDDSNAVVIDVADYGADKTGKRDSAEAIWEAFEAAKAASANGASSVTVSFPKGEYHIYKDRAQTREYHTSNTNSIENPVKTIGLLIEDQKNFTLEGNGSL